LFEKWKSLSTFDNTKKKKKKKGTTTTTTTFVAFGEPFPGLKTAGG